MAIELPADLDTKKRNVNLTWAINEFKQQLLEYATQRKFGKVHVLFEDGLAIRFITEESKVPPKR